eukprot:gene2284-2457_t
MDKKFSLNLDADSLLSAQNPSSENQVKRTNSLMDFVLKSPKFNSTLRPSSSFRFGSHVEKLKIKNLHIENVEILVNQDFTIQIKPDSKLITVPKNKEMNIIISVISETKIKNIFIEETHEATYKLVEKKTTTTKIIESMEPLEKMKLSLKFIPLISKFKVQCKIHIFGNDADKQNSIYFTYQTK